MAHGGFSLVGRQFQKDHIGVGFESAVVHAGALEWQNRGPRIASLPGVVPPFARQVRFSAPEMDQLWDASSIATRLRSISTTDCSRICAS